MGTEQADNKNENMFSERIKKREKKKERKKKVTGMNTQEATGKDKEFFWFFTS